MFYSGVDDTGESYVSPSQLETGDGARFECFILVLMILGRVMF